MSNLSEGSTMVEALCILKESDQPLFIYNSAVLFEPGLKRREMISVGKSAFGIRMVAFDFRPFLLSSPLKLND